MSSRGAELLQTAKAKAQTSTRWADLWNFLFDPEEGVIAKAYPSKREREAFVQTDEYRAIRQLIREARQRTGLVEGATPAEKLGSMLPS